MSENQVQKVESNNKKQKGASLVEYALLVALIAVVAIAAVTALGTKVSQKFSQTTSALV